MDAVHEGSSGGPVLMPESTLHACVLGAPTLRCSRLRNS